ncbi:hypothetical protein [Clostridiisalibacter paucivorans]|uniref:hypothetical protein n=1 Tax=Clostridiisalibacter paucivorans TaxID=408753 RepID=UPI0012EB6B3D|nr:hypothetical protein [Clostridiisalibacter paucivorans]
MADKEKFSIYKGKKKAEFENQINGLVFPWSMIRDVDAIDTMRFYTNSVINNVQDMK